MTVTQVLVVTNHPSGTGAASGGVELENFALLRAAAEAGMDHGLVTPDQADSAMTRSNTLIFVQKSGRLGPGYEGYAQAWLDRGAWVFEKNVFALASPWRPIHERYVNIVMSEDGWQRFQFRSKAAGRPMPAVSMILGNPQLVPPSSLMNRPTDRLRFLRIGRPDPIKWSNFEQRYAAAVARVRPDTMIELVRVGCPPNLVNHATEDLPNLSIVDEPYRSDISDAYGAAHVYLHHSRIGETFGNTVAEARAAGTPVVLGASLRWDCASVELLTDAASVYGSPADLIRHPQASLTRALALPSTPADLTLPSEFLAALISVTQGGGSTLRARGLGDMHGHLRRLKRGSQWMADQFPGAAMAIEALRAMKTRTVIDE